jgi:hypothetical protein
MRSPYTVEKKQAQFFSVDKYIAWFYRFVERLTTNFGQTAKGIHSDYVMKKLTVIAARKLYGSS